MVSVGWLVPAMVKLNGWLVPAMVKLNGWLVPAMVKLNGFRWLACTSNG